MKEGRGMSMYGSELSDLETTPASRRIGRRELLRLGGLLLGVAGGATLLSACGTSAPSPAPTRPPAVVPTAPPPPPTPVLAQQAPAQAAPATAAQLPSSLTVSAREDGGTYLLESDTLAVPAGLLPVMFKNNAQTNHELWLYPLQDLSSMLTQKRLGQDVTETDYIKGIAGQVNETEPGKTASMKATLAPGFYELACFMLAQNPDGSTAVHFDKGQSTTIAAVGPGGPSPAVLTPASSMNINLAPSAASLADTWLFTPDRLVVRAGQVSFSVTNKMDLDHELVVYPITDVSAFIPQQLVTQGTDYSAIKGQQVLDKIPVGKTMQGTAQLTPGTWVAACWMVSKSTAGNSFVHRDKGQRFTFQVK
jgi:uncharacterized cupredoxin-like copper-binding protein